jgi:putative ABC transport system substrate-binding protein
MMRRTIRFIITLVLALLVAPLAAAAPPGKVSRIAFLFAGSPTRPTMSTAIQEAFRQRLQELAWIHGQNLAVEFRWAEWRFERLPTLATELVQLPVDLIAVGSGLELLAAKQATRTIPIVMVLALDAVEQGFVASLAQPGANVTGVTAMTADLNQKRLELLKELVPGSARMAVLACQNPAPGQGLRMPAAQGWGAMQHTARTLGVHLQPLEVRAPEDYDEAFAAAIRAGGGDGRLCLLFQPVELAAGRDPRGPPSTARHLLCAGVGGSWRAHVLWAELAGHGPTRGHLCR